jgi:hypothetical protein
LCEEVVDFSLERDWVGWYFSLEKEFPPHFLVKVN